MRAAMLAGVFACSAIGSVPAPAAEATVPHLRDRDEKLAKPDLANVARVRFLTTVDFPPFSYLDAYGRLGGFNVDLARGICATLGIETKCEIQALPWNELDAALARGDGEAILAGVSVTAQSRERYAFSQPYLGFPARFAMRKSASSVEPDARSLGGKRVGVEAGSMHEKFLRDYFPAVRAIVYDREGWARDDLKAGKIDALFADGMRLSFWLSGSDAAGCCRFAGGPYLAPDYFGRGLAIATLPANETLIQAFDHALNEMDANGRFAELYLRYFPLGFY